MDSLYKPHYVDEFIITSMITRLKSLNNNINNNIVEYNLYF